MDDKFKLPIYYIENKEELSENIKVDLELVKKNNEELGLYNNILESESEFGNNLICMSARFCLGKG